jgi:hypothetical protein
MKPPHRKAYAFTSQIAINVFNVPVGSVFQKPIFPTPSATLAVEDA